MDSTKDTASGEHRNPQSVTTNAEDDPLLALSDLFSEASQDGHEYVFVPMSRPLSALLPTPQLNDDCCLALFNQFSLQEQLQLRAVCRQWQAIIEQKCRRMRSLKTFKRVIDVDTYCYNLMYLKLQDDGQYKLKPVGSDDDLLCSFGKLQQCAHLFADITTFVCYEYSKSNLDPIPLMFSQLTTLILCTQQSPFTIINSLPALTSVHLRYLVRYPVIPKDLSILRQLETFSLISYHGPHTPFLLSQLGPNLTRLTLIRVYLPTAHLLSAIMFNPSLATSITHLTIGYLNSDNPNYQSLLDLICSHFINLVYLHFYCIDLDWLPSLTKQQHITELHIDILNFPASVPRHLPQVSSVKQLHFTFNPIPTAAVNLQSLFPAVESICIYHHQEDQLERARQYMSQFSITCPVTFHVQNCECYMGRHRKASLA